MNEQIFNQIASELSHAGEDAQELQLLERLEQRRITPDKEIPPMQFLFQMFCKPCFPRGELVAIAGKAKSGKTFVCSILMALCFREEVLTVRRLEENRLSVLWVDTEQSEESTQDILNNRVLPMIGKGLSAEECNGLNDELFNPLNSTSTGLSTGCAIKPLTSYFNIFNVRADFWQERLPLLEAAMRRYKPDLVILDGIRDLVNDINDGVMAQDVIERLMHLASEQRCCLVCILHQNKGAEDKNLRGWIGTELKNKAFEVYECEKSEDRIFSFCQKLTRKYDILDTLKYIVDEQGIPQLASIEKVLESEQRQRQQTNSSRPDLNRAYIIDWDGNKPVFDLPTVFADAMPEEGKLYIAKDMQQEVMKLTNITSPYFYNTLREQALKDSLIIKTNNEHGYVAYYRQKSEVEKIQSAQVVQPSLFPDFLNSQNSTLPPAGDGDAPF